MSVDIQIVFPVELIQLNSVSVIPGSKPKTLSVLGLDFRSVDEVKINEITAPKVIVLSKNRLIAQIPDVLQNGNPVLEVSVISRNLTLSPKSLIQFKLGKTPSKVKGILRLVQLFLKILFTTPGTDIFSKRVGGAALRNIGRNFGKEDGGNIITDFTISVGTTSRQIIAIQSRDPGIPRNERLLGAKVTSATFDIEQTALIVSIELMNQSGQVASANVMV